MENARVTMGVGGGAKKMTNVALKAAEAKVIIGEKLKTIFGVEV